MFTNAGRKIKIFSKIIFWVVTIIALLVGITMLGNVDWSYQYIIAISLIIGGPITVWILSLLMYGFGELIEKTCNIEKTLVNTPAYDNRKSKTVFFVDDHRKQRCEGTSRAAVQNKDDKTDCFDEINEQLSETDASFLNPVEVVLDQDGMIICPKCGFKQRGDRTICFNCEQPFGTK